MAKAFFFKNETTAIWCYGTFKADGVTVDSENTIKGDYRMRWETIDSIARLSILNAYDTREVSPFLNIKITEVAKDINGTPYLNRADFEAATNGFFLKASTAGIGGGGFAVTSITGDNVTVDFTMPDNCDINGEYFITNDSLDATLMVVGGVKTLRFTAAPTDEQFTYVCYTPTTIPDAASYDQYTVVLNQSGTAVPVATVMLSTIIGSVWSYSAIGTYIVTNVGKFIVGKTTPVKATTLIFEDGHKITVTPIDVDSIKVESYNTSGVLADDILVNDEITILIYK